jgi:hypothetical protein
MNELTSVYGLLCQGLSQVASHEQSHVDLLSGALGNDAVQPCNYKL